MDSGFLKLILLILVIMCFVFILLKIWLTPDDYSLSLPEEVQEYLSNVGPTGAMCNVTGIDNLVNSGGNAVTAEQVPCSTCSSYYSLINNGTCLSVYQNEQEGACESDPLVKPMACPFKT